MEESRPLVSIIVRTKDRPKLLKRALQSVASQTYRPVEVVLVNDGGCDLDIAELKGILRDVSLNYQRLEKNTGRSHAGNVGIENAGGEFIGLLDDDDQFYPEHIESLMAILSQGEYKVAYTDAESVFQEWAADGYVDVRKEVIHSQDFDRRLLLIANYIPMLSLLFRKNLILETSVFDEKLEAHEDWDLWLRLSQYSDFYHIKKTTARFSMRTDATTITGGNRKAFLESARIIHRRYLPAEKDEITLISQNIVAWSLAKEVVSRGEEIEGSSLVDLAEAVLKQKDIHIGNLEAAAKEMKTHIGNLEAVAKEMNVHIENLKAHIENLDAALREKDSQIGNLISAANEKDTHMENLQAALREKDFQIADIAEKKDAQIADLQSRLNVILNSRGWKFLLIYYRIRGFLLSILPGRKGETTSGPLQRISRGIAVAGTLFRAVPRAVSYCGSLPSTIRRALGLLKRSGVSGVMRRANILVYSAETDGSQKLSPVALYGEAPLPDSKFMPKVSVIVPNFNHAKYLPARLESVYGQTYVNFEVILLDDCSGDESVAILRDYANRYPDKTICRFNEVNSGGVFNQWKKGLELATGELVWIAESDDYCSSTLLEELVRFFQNQAVMLAFARSDFMRGDPPKKVWTSEEYLSDLGLAIWDKPFIQSAQMLVKNGWAIKNLVANVSSAVFRNPGSMALFEDSEWRGLRLCGDWIFYLSLIRGGLVAYSPNVTNYYRQHPLNISVNAQNENLYYREFEVVAGYLVENYALEESCLKKQERHLYEHWHVRRGSSSQEEFRSLYDLDRVRQRSKARKPNLVMAVFALAAGGGETFPIMLANLLHSRGYAVTVLNCSNEPTEPGVRRMLRSSIPLLELQRLELVEAVFNDMAVELVHSHHAWVDVTLATLLMRNHNVKHVITMHGMYEMMEQAQLKQLLPLLMRRPDYFVYTAEKNLAPFSERFRSKKKFSKIDNALPSTSITLVPRAELNVGKEDFVLCLVSRAMPEKGWEEAIDAVVWANARSVRKIHLLLIGEGAECERLTSRASHDFVHFLGFRPNIRNYFATSDMGFLPSRFKGESFPLVLIDCLQAGKPFLASDVGEIRSMLDSGDGPAGELFKLDNWQIPVETVGQIIHRLANDPEAYQRLLRLVPLAAAKFDTGLMVDKYEAVYSSCLQTSENVAADISMREKVGQI